MRNFLHFLQVSIGSSSYGSVIFLTGKHFTCMKCIKCLEQKKIRRLSFSLPLALQVKLLYSIVQTSAAHD
jgi:hypothetical protein